MHQLRSQKKLFTEINTLLSSFLWGTKPPRVSLDTLFLLVQASGLALPILQCYYLAAQLTHIHWCFFPQMDSALVEPQAALMNSLKALINVMYRNSGRVVL